MNAPGSPSSALQTIYFFGPGCTRVISHFLPVGKPPPPRPLRPDAKISLQTSWSVISLYTLHAAKYPFLPIYSTIEFGSMCPQFARTILFCLA